MPGSGSDAHPYELEPTANAPSEMLSKGCTVPRVGSTRVTQTQGALGPYSSCCE